MDSGIPLPPSEKPPDGDVYTLDVPRSRHLREDVREILLEAATERKIQAQSNDERAKANARPWTAGLVVALLAVVASVLFLAQPRSDDVTTRSATRNCHERQREIMRAVVLYGQRHGRAPANLSLLVPEFLNGRPVDPETGKPYRYKTDGDIVTLACPEPGRGAATG